MTTYERQHIGLDVLILGTDSLAGRIAKILRYEEHNHSVTVDVDGEQVWLPLDEYKVLRHSR